MRRRREEKGEEEEDLQGDDEEDPDDPALLRRVGVEPEVLGVPGEQGQVIGARWQVSDDR